tara:strand:- start:347 stop:640 length:294 start_codon:yes stop_codon:yes gene_type:complete
MMDFNVIAKSLGKIVPSFLKDHQEKLSSKRIFKLGGGGLLITKGIDFLNKGVDFQNQNALIAGAICIAVGGLLAVGLSEKIKDLTNVKNEKAPAEKS